MASVTNSDEKRMATDEADRLEESHEQKALDYATPRGAESAGGGFFSIYKKGQGYWTRLGTAAGALAIIFGTAYFLYGNLPAIVPWFDNHPDWKLGIVGGLTILTAFLAWKLMNKPDNVDFLIATDSEMKKVNWTSRRELIGSTKVVIVFMFAIALFLFLNDVLWGYVFYILTVLKSKPF